MLRRIKACAPWLSGKTLGIIALVAVGFVLCGIPLFSLAAGILPILLIIACAIPCAAPLLMLRGANKPRRNPDLTLLPAKENSECACGQDRCEVGSNACRPESSN